MPALILGIDIGGTKLACAVGDRSGRLLARARRPTEASGRPEADVARIADEARRLLERFGARLSDVALVGVSVPGPCDPATGRVLNPPNLPGWGEVPLAAWLEKALGRPVQLENDANAAALAEWRFGAGRGCANLAYLTMSTGVGAGLVLGGRIHRGIWTSAGEIGHAPVEWDGEVCACGLRGCLEAYVGGAAWTRRLRASAPESSLCVGLAGGRASITPEHALEAARQGDAFALSELARWNEYLARAIVQLAFTLAPEVVVLGTIATAAGEALCFEPVRERVRARTWRGVGDAMRIVPAALGDELPYRAALCAGGAGSE